MEDSWQHYLTQFLGEISSWFTVVPTTIVYFLLGLLVGIAGYYLFVVRHKVKRAKQAMRSAVQQHNEIQGRISRVSDNNGRIWLKEAQSAEEKAGSRRRAKLISIVNLKGGVGKTTITANLGATLAQMNNRVLLVDLDYQGSLTNLFFGLDEYEALHNEKIFLDSLFDDSNLDPLSLVERIRPHSKINKLYCLPSFEHLADFETLATFHWVLGDGKDDIRFRLRDHLWSSGLMHEFDIILFDCPPRLTAAFVNALTASDWCLIPSRLDNASMEAIPRLLKTVRTMKNVFCQNLELLGVVGSQIYNRDQLTRDETDIIKRFSVLIDDAWGEPVHLFPEDTYIRQRNAVSAASNTRELAIKDKQVRENFQILADQVVEKVFPAYGSKSDDSADTEADAEPLPEFESTKDLFKYLYEQEVPSEIASRLLDELESRLLKAGIEEIEDLVIVCGFDVDELTPEMGIELIMSQIKERRRARIRTSFWE